VLTFPSVTGSINPIKDYARFVSAAGDQGHYGATDVTSFGGISGIIHRRNGMFLVGVLLADSSPAEPAASAAGMERCFDGVFNDSLKINRRHDFDDHIGYGATYHWCAADGQVTTFVVDTTYGEDAG
jgi:hypothetical protein